MYIESVEDFKRRLQDTFVFITLNNKDILVKFKGINEDGKFVGVSTKYGNICINYEDAQKTVKYSFPKAGLYNVNDECVLFCRTPRRQWKRAPCYNNSALTALISYINPYYKTENISYNEDNLEQVYKAEYPTNVILALAKMKKSVALSSKIGVTHSNKSKEGEYLLWYKSHPIGYIDITTLKIIVHVKEFYQEIVDFFTKEKEKWTVSLN